MKKIFERERSTLIAILLLAIINGLAYIFFVPPWQHYDEPNHFEYVWWLANHSTPLEITDYDTDMRQAVAQSMIDHGFFEGNVIPLPDLTADKPWIGQYSQAGEPIFYYLLASLPLRILPTGDVTIQLYTTRMVSLILFLVTILAGWGVTAEITLPRHPLRYMVPLTMVLLPAFVDLMTAVNNDASGVAAFSLFLWGSSRLIRRSFSLWTLLFVLFATGLCIFSKRTGYIAVPLLGIVLVLTFFRGRFRKFAWGLLAIIWIVAISAIFSWGDASLWYRNSYQSFPTRNSTAGIVGDSAFHIQLQSGKSHPKLVQILPVETAKLLSEHPLSLGVWVWSSRPIEINSAHFSVFDRHQTFGQTIAVDETPRFYAFTFTPKGNSARAWVILEPGTSQVVEQPVDVFYDGVVLAVGDFPIDEPPELSADGSEGTWSGVPFENLVRNGSAEGAWLYLRPWVENSASQLFSEYQGQEKLSLILYSLLDWPSTGWYYSRIATNLFRTFWAKFGWGHVSLVGAKPYKLVLFPFTVIAFLGVGLGLWQRRKRLSKLPWDIYFFLGIASFVIWGMALIRGTSYLFSGWSNFVVARYAFPAIIPTILMFSAGWLVLLELIENRLALPTWNKYFVYFGGLLTINVFSLISISIFYL